jgi:ABC-type lipoprotein export system ATPase subunit
MFPVGKKDKALSIVERSGSGKSTLFQLIGGTLNLTGGDITRPGTHLCVVGV